uniref:Uncharacterized protein n=1 Tax=Graphocephala atropunctata TaxID=36148 RepID=A0A1B6LPN4_9HEMI
METMKVLVVVVSLVTCALTGFHIEFSVYPQKLRELDGNITRILNSSSPGKEDSQDLLFGLQSYVYTLGPLTRIMPSDMEVHGVAKTIYERGEPAFASVPVKMGVIQMAFKWTDVQMKVLHFVYDNAVKHWNDFVTEYEKLDIIV